MLPTVMLLVIISGIILGRVRCRFRRTCLSAKDELVASNISNQRVHHIKSSVCNIIRGYNEMRRDETRRDENNSCYMVICSTTVMRFVCIITLVVSGVWFGLHGLMETSDFTR